MKKIKLGLLNLFCLMAVLSPVFLFTISVTAQTTVINDLKFGAPTEDPRFCQLYSQFAQPLFSLGTVIIVIGFIGIGIYMATSKGNPNAVENGKKWLLYLTGIFALLLIVTQLPQSIYNLVTAGKFQSKCFQ